MSLDVSIIVSFYLVTAVLLFSLIEFISLRRGHKTNRIHIKEIVNIYMVCLIWPISIVVWSINYNIRFSFVWYDIFIGFYIDTNKGKMYISVFPCCVYTVEPYIVDEE